MANILPVSDLRNYNEVLKNCHKGEPVYLTKNGRGRFVVMDIEDYERDRAEKKLLMKLQEAEEAVKDGEGWLSTSEEFLENSATVPSAFAFGKVITPIPDRHLETIKPRLRIPITLIFSALLNN